MKRGILLAAFGSSNPGAHRTLDRFDQKVRGAFPGIPIRWAFTSGFIRRKLADGGMKTDSVAKALKKMAFEKYSHVAVQSLHVVPGAEFNELVRDACGLENRDACCATTQDACCAPSRNEDARGQGSGQSLNVNAEHRARFERILVGAPLLASAADAARVALAVVRHLPQRRAPQDAVVLMGHGTWHQGNSMYDLLADALRELDARICIGTMADKAAIRDIAAALAAEGVLKVWLMPLLAVAGAHVIHDMAGEHPDSWKSVIAAAGLTCEPIMTSAAEYDGFAAIWIDHLRETMTLLDG